MKEIDYVIVGSGPAGIFAAEAIRKRDQEAGITMVSADETVGYSPVMLTYWLSGERPRETLFFRDPSWIEKNRIDFHGARRMTFLKASLRKIVLEDDREILYDRLLIATGSTPISLSIPGIQSRGVTSLRTLQDAEKILEGGSGIREVLIIGGGFIGLKLACHLQERGLRVMVFEKEPKLASRMFDLKASEFVKEKLLEKGIVVETGVEVTEISQEQGRVSGARTKDGRSFSCQKIIEAVGVRPNAPFLKDSGVELYRGGVPVNDSMETNVPGIFAAGDVALTIDPITSERVNNATWAAASGQGRVAGSNMAGDRCTYTQNFTLNALNLFGFQLMTAGHAYVEQAADTEVLVEDRKECYRKIVLQNGRVIGFILMGDVSGGGYLLSLMKRRNRLSGNPLDLLKSPHPFARHLLPNTGYRHGLLSHRPIFPDAGVTPACGRQARMMKIPPRPPFSKRGLRELKGDPS